ncbi:MAG TPA: hypothetical protein ENJ83_01665 [Rhodospirillales bacterium]|nr:hypothetical protein [Rhodospirillales bacterium]
MARPRRKRFVDLAEKRVTRAIKDLRLIGNLANRSNYQYDDRDVEKIIRALENELRLMKRRFEIGGAKEEIVFRLEDHEPVSRSLEGEKAKAS